MAAHIHTLNTASMCCIVYSCTWPNAIQKCSSWEKKKSRELTDLVYSQGGVFFFGSPCFLRYTLYHDWIKRYPILLFFGVFNCI